MNVRFYIGGVGGASFLNHPNRSRLAMIVKILLSFVVGGALVFGASSARAQTTTNTTCSANWGTVNCTSVTPPTDAERQQQYAEFGQNMRGMVDRIHARHQANAEKKINALLNRTNALISDDFYNDTLMYRAIGRADTTAAIRFARDRIAMDAQVQVVLDSLDAMEIKQGMAGVPRPAFHHLSERIEYDRTLAALADSIERGRR